MTGEPGEGLFDPKPFSLPLDPELPPLPGEGAEETPSPPLIARRLWSLIQAAEIAVLPAPPGKAGNTLLDELEALATAARGFSVAPGLGLDEVLWTRSGPYWNGEMAAKLKQAFSGEPALGFVLLAALGVTRRAALLGHAQPFVVEEEIVGGIQTPGPHLVLVACTVDAIGRARALRGYAQPVWSRQCLMPVAGDLERGVLTAIAALRERLDARGLGCALRRPFDHAKQCFADHLHIVLGEGDASRRLIIDFATGDGATDTEDDGARFVVTSDRFADGSFVAWLERMITAPGARPEARSRKKKD